MNVFKPDDGALKPESFTISNYLKQPKVEKDVAQLTEEEKILAAGADNAFWLTLKEHFAHELEKIDQINELAMANGATREQIGENTIIISLVKGVLKRIMGSVQDAKEAQDARGGQQ